MAVFDVDVLPGVNVQGPAVTDQLNTMLSALPQVTLVNREQLKKVAEEHQIALSGLVETASAVKLGKFLSAQYIVVGRASQIGPTLYLVLKIVDVETTEQTTVSVKAPVEDGFATVLERLSDPLAAKVRQLQRPTVNAEDAALAELRKLRPAAGGQGGAGGGRGNPRRPAAARSGRANGRRRTAPQPGVVGDLARGARKARPGIRFLDSQD